MPATVRAHERTSALDLPGGPRSQVASKRSLLAASRAIESMAARVSEVDPHTVVVAMFQEAAYLEQSLDRYRDLARRCDVVVAGANGADALTKRGGLVVADLPAGHGLSDEWAVVSVSGVTSAALVAVDMNRTGAGSSSENARLFEVQIGTRPRWVAGHLERIVTAAGPLLSEAVIARLLDSAGRVGTIEDVVHDATTGPDLEDGWRRLVESVEVLQRTERLAMRDPLTGAFNRRMLERYLAGAGPRSGNGGQMAVAGFDLDQFKAVNDRFGHTVGDAVLVAFAEAVRSATRDGDVLVRLGGDEFTLLLPSADAQSVSRVAWRVLDLFSAAEIPDAPGLKPRASAGVGVFPADAVDFDAVDAALYRAKGSRDRVAFVDED